MIIKVQSSSLIETKNLSFAYNGKMVLQDISLSIEKSQTWSVIGRNGAGKSTLIKCIAGLLPVKTGTVFVNGSDILKVKPRERAKIIAYVPQAAGRAIADYTVFDYAMLGRFPYQGLMAMPNDRDRRIVSDALHLTDVARLKDRLMTTLSGGELQRVFLAGAVAQQSEILLLDEPATFLDPLHQELIRKTLERIHEEFGISVITITHDANAAVSGFTNLLALVDGKSYYAGRTSDFRRQCPEILREIFSVPFEEARCSYSDRTIIIPGETP
jgi:iron complex transport system ATP-binding protein